MSALGLLIDMDGVIYRDKQLVPGAVEFIDNIKDHEIPFSFCTNNTECHPRAYLDKLTELGIFVQEEQLYSASIAAADHLAATFPTGHIFVLGSTGLKTLLQERGLKVVGSSEKADCVLVGEMRELSYYELCHGVNLVKDGLPFFATNPDKLIPSMHGDIIGCGAFAQLIGDVTHSLPTYFGKPAKSMAVTVANRLGISLQQLIVIGDNLETDIKMAKAADIRSILVLSGLTTPQDLQASQLQPGKVVSSVAQLASGHPQEWL